MVIRVGAACLLLVQSVCGCQSEQSYMLGVDLRTDFNPGIELDGARVLIDGVERGGSRLSAADNVTLGAHIFEGEITEGRHLVTVRLENRGAQIAERSYQLDVRSNVGLIAVISRSCAGQFGCTSGQTCIDGRCGSTSCITGLEPECASSCGPTMECSPTLCSPASRVAGSCIAELSASSCEPWEYCDPSLGCRLRPSEMPPATDAGFDGGFDAGFDGGFDAGFDGGFDAGFDGGFDAGFDSGPPPLADPPADTHLPPAPWVDVPVRLQGGCPPVTACAGNVEGIWDISGGCIEIGVAADDLSAIGCTIVSQLTARVRGRMRVGPNQMFQITEWEAQGQLVANGCDVPCQFIEGPVESGVSAAIGHPVDCSGCSCDGGDSETITNNGPYTLNLGSMAVSGQTFRFCGGRVQRTDESSTFTLTARPLRP